MRIAHAFRVPEPPPSVYLIPSLPSHTVPSFKRIDSYFFFGKLLMNMDYSLDATLRKTPLFGYLPVTQTMYRAVHNYA